MAESVEPLKTYVHSCEEKTCNQDDPCERCGLANMVEILVLCTERDAAYRHMGLPLLSERSQVEDQKQAVIDTLQSLHDRLLTISKVKRG